MAQVEDVADLMHSIISYLPPGNEVARTSVLSKSWLHAWSTIPHLRFYVSKKQHQRNHIKLVEVDRTVARYLRDNTPIHTFDIFTDIENQDSASLVEELIRTVATKTKTGVKELLLSVDPSGASFNFPVEILSAKNLSKLRIASSPRIRSSVFMASHHPVIINCVSLRELYLRWVDISQEILDGILSSCNLLVKIELILCSSRYLNTIKVKNLPYLYELTICTKEHRAFEINHVPNLRLFRWDICRTQQLLINNSISLGSNVRELSLSGVIRDKTSLDMINLGLPLLESLTLDMACWTFESFHFTNASMKRFVMEACRCTLVDIVHVDAPKLLFFSFCGSSIPSFVFPVSTLEHIMLRLRLGMPVDASYFLRMREALALSSKCDVDIKSFNRNIDTLKRKRTDLPFGVDFDDLRTRLTLPPATNVQQLSFQTRLVKRLWGRSSFFDVFFEICHPDHVFAKRDKFLRTNHFGRLMLREVLEEKTTPPTAYWPRYLKHVQIRPPGHEKWETFTNAHISFLQGSLEFKLMWAEVCQAFPDQRLVWTSSSAEARRRKSFKRFRTNNWSG